MTHSYCKERITTIFTNKSTILCVMFNYLFIILYFDPFLESISQRKPLAPNKV